MTTETLRIEVAPQTIVELPLRPIAIALIGELTKSPANVAPLAGVPKIGDVWPGQGGVYAGVARGRDGEPDYHLICGPESDSDLDWDDAMKWATTQSVDGHNDFRLPTRKEQALLFANVSELFKDRYYWSCEQHAGDSDFAWMQYFGVGSQDYYHESDGYRVRAVRRLPIQ